MTTPQPETLVPVGFPLGFGPDTGGTELTLAIRCAGVMLSVTPEVHDVWWQARFHPELPDLVKWGGANGVRQTEAVVAALRRDGLVQRLDDRLLRTHRLLPTAFGTGCDETEPDLFTIRDTGMEPVLVVDQLAYTAWGMSDGIRTLAEVAALIVATSNLSAEQVTTALLRALPVLLGANVAVLDRSG